MQVLPSTVAWSGRPDRKPPMPAHRLDSRVCGVVLCVKTHTAGMLLGRQFENAQVQKRYRAIVVGRLECDPISGRIRPPGRPAGTLSPPPSLSTGASPDSSTLGGSAHHTPNTDFNNDCACASLPAAPVATAHVIPTTFRDGVLALALMTMRRLDATRPC